jgi:subtilisin family serine protease
VTTPRQPNGTQDPNDTRTTFFRYGEIVLIFSKPVGETPDDCPTIDEVVTALQANNIRLSSTPFVYRARDGLRDRQPINFVSQGEQICMQVVNLAGWREDLEDRADANGEDALVIGALQEVSNALVSLDGAVINIRGWQLAAYSPEWNAVMFDWEDGGGPGGRHILAPGQKRFRPGGDPAFVRGEVERILGRNVSNDVPGGMRIAILDTWPMYDEECNTPGQVASEPFKKIEEFAVTLDPRNPVLDGAIAGNLVKEVYDYVSCRPSMKKLTRFNWTTNKFEPAYDVSDHGLFIADIIKDIARDARIYIYRVLNEYGGGDFTTIVQAFHRAIEDAGDEPLIINMSLGFAPPLVTVMDVLDDPINQPRASAWASLMTAKARTDVQYAAHRQLDAQRLINAGLARRVGKRFEFWGRLRAAEYSFRPPDWAKVFAVAAAGNDSFGERRRFGPRLPASIEGILGVSAEGASFSNRDDTEDVRDDGISAFGGDAHNDPNSDIMRTSDGIVGAAIAPDLPPPSDDGSAAGTMSANYTGWALWAGTSFATPVATGLAACIWAEDMNLTSDQLMSTLIGTTASHKEIKLRQI